MSGLKDILGVNKKTMTLSGQEIEITPLRLKNLAIVLDKKDIIESLFNGQIKDVIISKFNDVIELLASVSGQTKEFVENLEIHEVIDLVEAIVEMNSEGFFLAQKKIAKLDLTKLSKKQDLNGKTPSSSSSKKATTQKEFRSTQ